MDTMVHIGPNGAAPPPFAARRYRWIACELDGYEGFQIEVRSNLLNREKLEFQKAYRAIGDYEKWWLEQLEAWSKEHPDEVMPDDHALQVDTPRRRTDALVAPYVRAWNAMGVLVDDDDGNETPIPAPADGGPDVFLLTEEVMRDWIVGKVLVGYLSGKGIRPSFAASKPSPAASDGPHDPR